MLKTPCSVLGKIIILNILKVDKKQGTVNTPTVLQEFKNRAVKGEL